MPSVANNTLLRGRAIDKSRARKKACFSYHNPQTQAPTQTQGGRLCVRCLGAFRPVRTWETTPTARRPHQRGDAGRGDYAPHPPLSTACGTVGRMKATSVRRFCFVFVFVFICLLVLLRLIGQSNALCVSCEWQRALPRARLPCTQRATVRNELCGDR